MFPRCMLYNDVLPQSQRGRQVSRGFSNWTINIHNLLVELFTYMSKSQLYIYTYMIIYIYICLYLYVSCSNHPEVDKLTCLRTYS